MVKKKGQPGKSKKGGGNPSGNPQSGRQGAKNTMLTRGEEASPALARGGKKKKGKAGNNSNNNNTSFDGSGDDDERLRRSIEADGTKTVLEMSADGNCLFRALSDQLYHDYGNQHDGVRADICDYIAGHANDFKFFVFIDEDDEDAADLGQYVERMRDDGEWGGNVELVAAARLYRRNITVYSATLAAFTIEHGHINKNAAGPDLLISYHDNDHYNSVRDGTRGKPPPPIKTFEKGVHDENATSNSQTDDPKPDSATKTPSSKGQKEKVEGEVRSGGEKRDDKPPVKKSAPCPCGSGLKFKKCCFAKEKHKARLGKLQREKAEQPEDEPREPEMSGAFRVLKI